MEHELAEYRNRTYARARKLMAGHVAPPPPCLSGLDIKIFRTRVRMSQSVLALYLGVSRRQLSRWEGSDTAPIGASMAIAYLMETLAHAMETA